MRRPHLLLLLFALITMPGEALAQVEFTTLVGKSSCSSELSGHVGVYGVRLDKTQKAYLSAHTLGKRNILTIVQYARDGDECGTVKDVVQSQDVDNYFEFDCEDHSAPSAIVVGTWPSKNNANRGTPVEAWRIDLQRLRFSPAKSQVTCIRQSFEGSDEGDDLATWAKERAAKKRAKNSAR